VAGVDVPVERVVADVELPVGEPAVERRIRGVERRRRRHVPVDGLCGAQPERLRIVDAGLEHLVVGTHRRSFHSPTAGQH
jgi:hypothetical protein